MVTKLEVLLKAYDEVNALTKHEDQKAERALTAMAFIVLGGATLFAATFVSSGWKQFAEPELQWAYGMFACFLVLAISGTLIVLYAIFPRFKIPPVWKGKGEVSKLPPRSVFFGIEIAKQTSQSWESFWNAITPEDLEAISTSQLVYETHLIAEKIIEKVRPLRVGWTCFILSLMFLIVAVLLLLLSVFH